MACSSPSRLSRPASWFWGAGDEVLAQLAVGCSGNQSTSAGGDGTGKECGRTGRLLQPRDRVELANVPGHYGKLGDVVDFEDGGRCVVRLCLSTKLSYNTDATPSEIVVEEDALKKADPPHRGRRFEAGDEVVTDADEDMAWTARQVVKYLGSGTFGDVYEVKTNEEPTVHEAMKIIALTDVRTGLPVADQERVRRLGQYVREAHVMLELAQHPNLVGIRAARLIKGDFCFFEDLVRGGRTLKSVLDAEELTAAQAAVVAFKMSCGLKHMHDKGFVHWDVKPDNILIQLPEDVNRGIGAVKLTGLGAATAVISDDDVDSMSVRELRALIHKMRLSTSECVEKHELRARAREARALQRQQAGDTKRWFRGCTEAFASPETLAILRNKTTIAEELRQIELAARTQDQWSFAAVVIEMITGTGSASRVRSISRDGAFCLTITRQCLSANPLDRPSIAELNNKLARGLASAGVQLHQMTIDVADEIAAEELSLDKIAGLHNTLGMTFLERLGKSGEHYEMAEHHFRKSLLMLEETYGSEGKEVSHALNNLALSLHAEGRLPEAKPLYERAILVTENALGPEDPDLATWLNNLAELLREQGRIGDAAPLYRRAVAITEKSLGPEHPKLAKCLSNLALLSETEGKIQEAAAHVKRAISIIEKVHGPHHPDLATMVYNLAELLRHHGRLSDAAPLYGRAIEIIEIAFGHEHPDLAKPLNGLALLSQAEGRISDASRLFERAISITEKALSPEKGLLATCLNNFALLLWDEDRISEAARLVERAISSNEKELGPDCPDLATFLDNLARLFSAQEKYKDALPPAKRAAAILRRKLGPQHPDSKSAEQYTRQLRDAISGCGPTK